MTFGPVEPPVPLVNVHAHDVIVPVEVLVNDTVSGAIPVGGAAVKEATGGAAVTAIALVADEVPPGPLTNRVAV